MTNVLAQNKDNSKKAPSKAVFLNVGAPNGELATLQFGTKGCISHHFG
jgi:hypothetical protein